MTKSVIAVSRGRDGGGQQAGTVTIQHEPIPAIGWPAMTMAFKATTPAIMRARQGWREGKVRRPVVGSKAQVTSIKPK